MCKETMKRCISFLLCVVMLLGNFPVVGFAAETDALIEEKTDDQTILTQAVPETELPDNEELFAGFAERKLYGYEIATFGTAGREMLNEAEKGIYDALKTQIEAVAANGGSTVFTLSDVSGLKTQWTNTELGVDSISDFSKVKAEFQAQFDLNKIQEALLSDCPFDLYWFDKSCTYPMQMSYRATLGASNVDGQLIYTVGYITEITVRCEVESDYQSGSYTVKSDVARIATARNNAAAIVAKYAGRTDYEKLLGYKDEICDAVSYNYDAAAESYTGNYGDPWQLIYVFDGDPSTNVVCEGYAKAFMYLCDLSSFTKGTVCYEVSGYMDQGTHMWNIVTLEGKNYLADVTNSDTGDIGEDGSLFLAGASGSVTGGYTIGAVRYTYDNPTLSLWGTGADSILTLASARYVPVGGGTGYPAIEEGVSTKVASLKENRSVYFSFTPKYTDNYVFYSTSADDSEGYIYSGDEKTCLASDDDSGTNYNFSVSYPMQANVTYVLRARNIEDDSTDTFYVHVKANHKGEKKVIKPATCTAEGVLSYVCDGCGQTLEEAIPKIPHGYVGGRCETCGNPHQSIASGICGSNVTWKLYDSGLLEIIGSGNMYTWSSSSSVPWNAYRDQITKVTMTSGITSIGAYSFYNCVNLSSATLASSATTIGEYAFRDCASLTGVTLPANLTSIGQAAFVGSGLTSGGIPRYVTYIADGAFSDCAKLREITVSGYNSTYTSKNGVLFNADKTKLLQYPAGKVSIHNGVSGVYQIPESVTEIGTSAFSACTGLKGVIFPENLVYIYDYAFLGCSGLTELDFPESLLYIGQYAFSDCTGVTALELPSKLWKLDRGAFSDCKFDSIRFPRSLYNLQNFAFSNTSVGAIYYEGTEAQWNKISFNSYNGTIQNNSNIYYQAFGSCGENVEYDFFDGILTISGQGPMTDYPDHTSSSTYTALPWYSFKNKIVGIVVEDGVTTIGNYAFYECFNVAGVSIGKDVKVIGKDAFNYCNQGGLSQITLPEGLTTIRDNAFWGCTKLTSMTIPASVTSIGKSAFKYCDRLSSITFRGSFPNMDPNGEQFYNLPAMTVNYPAGDATWSEDVRLDYGNNRAVTWKAYCLEHDFSNVTYTWAEDYSTCTASAVCAKGCGTDGGTETVRAVVRTVEPGCDTKGSITYTATFTSNGFAEQIHVEWIGSTGHTFDRKLAEENYLHTAATCTEQAVYYYSCACGAKGEETFSYGEPNDHDYKAVVTAPSCTADGYTTYTCVCGDTYTGDPVGKLGHDMGGWETTKAATCTVDGLKRRDCSRCDYFETDVISAPGHDWQSANCTQPKTCVACGETEGEAVHNGHNFINGVCSVCKIQGGKCGKELNWTMDSQGILRIYGSGEMYDYTYYNNPSPWDSASVTQIVIEAGATGIGHSAFAECVNVTKVTIPEGVKRIGQWAFMDCKNLQSVVLPDGLELLDECAFWACEKLMYVTMPDSLETIGYSAFRSCKLQSIKIPANVTFIGAHAFAFCEELTKVYITDVGAWLNITFEDWGANPLRVNEGPFNYLYLNDAPLRNLVIPQGITNINEYAFYNCSLIDTVVVPDSVTSIGKNAFGRITLSNIYYEATAEQWTALGSNAPTASYIHYQCVDAADHWQPMNKAATCTEAGYTYNGCACGYERNKQATDAAMGHNMGDWETTKEATCTADGLKRRDCSRCEHFETAVISAPGHNHKAVVTAPTCTADGYTTYTCICGDTYTGDPVNKLGHAMGDWETTKEATCTVDGSKRRDCSRCEHFETEVISAPGHNHKAVVTAPSCTAYGYTTYTCHCGDTYVSDKVNKLGHNFGGWTLVSQPTASADGKEQRKCSRCGHVESRIVKYNGNVLKLTDKDLASQTTVWINGLPCAVQGEANNRYVEVPVEGTSYMTTYTFHVGDAKDVHTQYPTGMKVYKITKGASGYTAKHIPELDNLLQYSGSSIRITGKKGIRMITSLNKATKTALTGKGLAGYKLEEYGTVLAFASEIKADGDLVLGKSYSRSNYAYKKGVADPVFADTGKLVQYTNVLVGFNLEQCKQDIAMRPYIILSDGSGNKITLYGGTIYRSIGYIAYQNRNVFKPGNGSYDYVWEIIHHVYGNKYDKDFKG